MDSIVHVSNVTGLVIAMEVPVQQSVHCRQYHSHTNLSRVCVDLLTEQIARDRHHASDPTNACVPAGDDIAKIPVKSTGYTVQRACKTN